MERELLDADIARAKSLLKCSVASPYKSVLDRFRANEQEYMTPNNAGT